MRQRLENNIIKPKTVNDGTVSAITRLRFVIVKILLTTNCKEIRSILLPT